MAFHIQMFKLFKNPPYSKKIHKKNYFEMAFIKYTERIYGNINHHHGYKKFQSPIPLAHN